MWEVNKSRYLSGAFSLKCNQFFMKFEIDIQMKLSLIIYFLSLLKNLSIIQNNNVYIWVKKMNKVT